jgi:hypothetical protein
MPTEGTILVATRSTGLRPEQPSYGWLSAVWAVLAGSLVALAPFVVIALSIDWLHLVPLGSPSAPGRGWPWRIYGAWSVLADIGPVLVAAAVVTGCVGFYVAASTGGPRARWPILICAAAVGWIPVASGHHAGLVGVSTGLGFALMLWTTHQTGSMPRRRLPEAHGRTIVASAGILALVLTAGSVSYGALHPIRVGYDGGAASATLRAGVSDLIPFEVDNDGPLAARLLGISVAGGRGVSVAAIEIPGPRSSGPTIDSLYMPAGTPHLAPGATLMLWLRFRGPARCTRAARLPVSALDVRLRVAGSERTQRVVLGPEPFVFLCRPTHHA